MCTVTNILDFPMDGLWTRHQKLKRGDLNSMKKMISILVTVIMLTAMVFSATAETTNDQIVLSNEASEAGITRGGTLIVAKYKPMSEGLDITQITDSVAHFTVMAQIYEGLLTIDEDGNIAPGLATEWTLSEDGLSLELKLREDVSFHNGEKFNAEAVAKCLNYYLTDECAHVFRSSDLSCIGSVDVLDEYTVRVNLTALDSAICSELSDTSGFIVAPAVIDGDLFSTQPIGTGPFMFKEYREGESIEVVAYPDYYLLGEDGESLPYLDGIKFIFMTDDTTKTANLQAGDVDGVDRHESTTSVLAAMAMDDMVMYRIPTLSSYNLACNLHYEPLQNEALRKAITYAVNCQEVIELSMEGCGETNPFWTGPGKWFYYDYTPQTYDTELAKEYLKEAGYEDGIDLELAIIAREPDNTAAQVVQAQLAEVGINITINAMDVASWIDYVRVERKEQLSISICGNTYEPSKGWVIILKAFGDVDTGLEMVDNLYKLVTDTKTTIDTDARYELIKEYQTIILDNALTTVLGQKVNYGSFASDIHDVKVTSIGWFDFHETWKE